MKHLYEPVYYLENGDFDEMGNLKNDNIPKNMPVVIMIQTKYCPHCTMAKPAFQNFAELSEGKVFCASIEGDGDRPGEVELAKKISNFFPNFRGFPDYVLYKNGKLVPRTISGRTEEHLFEFVK